MKLLFLSTSNIHFDVSTPERTALGGTESCVAYLAAELARTHEVCLLGNTTSQILRGVRHFPLSSTTVPALQAALSNAQLQDLDVIIVPNAPVLGPILRRSRPYARLVLWNHFAPDQPDLQLLARPECAQAFDALVHVSPWQRAKCEAQLRLPIGSRVIGNGLTPAFEAMFTDANELMSAKQLRAAYTSTPFRGLDVLLDSFELLPAPPHLDVFSSMQVYRASDAPFETLYERARSLPFVTYHGAVSQTHLADALRPVSFLSYPCTFPETFCIAALEAMAAGATVVTTAIGALPTTTLGYGELLNCDGLSRQELVRAFAEFFADVVTRSSAAPEWQAERMFDQVVAVNRDCTWRRRAHDWSQLFGELPPRRGDT